ncbi:MAG: hypothetical protein ACLRPU_00400 [Enterococcus hulanensis]
MTKNWIDNWTELVTFFKYPEELRHELFTQRTLLKDSIGN